MPPNPTESHSRLPWLVGILLVIVAGIFLRVYSFETLEGVGFDEKIYSTYVEHLARDGITSYPKLIDFYLTEQRKAPIVFLPPTRVPFLVAATFHANVFGASPVEALRAISCLAAIVTLVITALFANRMGGLRMALAMTALMAFAPTQIAMAHRALIDGFFGLTALIALWSLWEVLQNPNSRKWLGIYAASLCALVLTKENAAFVYFAALGLLVVNRWMHFGKITREVLVATLGGPCVGALFLILCAGGSSALYAVYEINVRMNFDLPYGRLHQDGPWFRYLVDLLLISPVIMIFAIGGAFTVKRDNKAALFLLFFVIFSYLVMGNLRHGINLRFANMWDFPLRWLALLPVLAWSERFTGLAIRRGFFFGMLGAMCLFEFSDYLQIFVDHQVYDPISSNLMRAWDMIKF